MTETHLIREVVSLGRAARSKANLRVRQPLATMLVKVKTDEEKTILERLQEQVLDEMNVKKLDFVKEEGELVTYAVKPAFALLGPKYGKKVGAIGAALGKLDAAVVARSKRSGKGVDVVVDGETLTILPDELDVRSSERSGYATAEEEGYLVGVSKEVTLELEQEGIAREIVRFTQDARKDAGLDIADRIVTYIQASEKVVAAVQTWADFVKQETLTVDLHAGPPPAGVFTAANDFEGEQVVIAVQKA